MKPFAYAYLVKGESKFEELRVIFARAADEVIVLSDDTAHTHSVIVVSSTDGAGDNEDGEVVVSQNHDNSFHYDIDALMAIEHIGNEGLQVGEPSNAWNDDEAMADVAIVPFPVEDPVDAVPLQAIPPLDMLEISSGSAHSSQFNVWDYLDISFSESDGSSATDLSTGHSVSNGMMHGRCIHVSKKKVGPNEVNGRVSSSSSNSAFRTSK